MVGALGSGNWSLRLRPTKEHLATIKGANLCGKPQNSLANGIFKIYPDNSGYDYYSYSEHYD